MATRKITETIQLTQQDIEEAITDWLHNKFGPPKPDMEHRPDLTAWRVSLRYSKSTSGSGWAEVDHESFTGSASREKDAG